VRALLFRIARPTRARSVSGRAIFIDPADARARRVFVFREPLYRPDLAAWLRLAELAEWTDIVDVGANYGEFIAALPRADRVAIAAFEPNPAVAQLLARTCAAARLSVAVERAAVGSGADDLVLHLGAESSGRSSVVSGGEKISSRELLVPQVRLADYLRARLGDERSTRRVLLKIDIEGHELAALEGLAPVWDELGDVAALVEAAHLGPGDWDELRSRYRVVALTGEGEWIALNALGNDDALRAMRRAHGFADVALFRAQGPSAAWDAMRRLVREPEH
jgi:FkbM family methyltransferase